MESKAAFNDEITMKDYHVLCVWLLAFEDYICY